VTYSDLERRAREQAVPPPGARAERQGIAGLRPGAAEAMLRPPDPEAPDRVIDFHPTGWSEKWIERPNAPIKVGIARIGEHHQMAARSAAIATADRLHPKGGRDSREWLESFNQALMHGCIAAALCKPHNRHEALWPQQAELLPVRVTTAGAERLFDELELVTVIEGPTRPEATSEQLFELGDDLTTGLFWQDMPMARVRHIRRLLAFVIELAEEPILQITPDD